MKLSENAYVLDEAINTVLHNWSDDKTRYGASAKISKPSKFVS